MQALYPEHAERILAVTNGFDDDEELPPSPASERFRVAYAGAVYIDRNPRTLFLAAARVIRELGLGPKDFAIELMGPVDGLDGLSVEQIADGAGIGSFVHVHAPGTRQAAAAFLATASVLVSLPQDSHMAIPSKVFEYMRYEASLLALAEPQSATAQLLRDTAADVVRPGDVDALADVLRRRYLEHREGRRPERIACDRRFSRRAQAERLFAAIDALLEAAPEPLEARARAVGEG
jgi:glycosyltransferase involved in cell wall biosynthesis